MVHLVHTAEGRQAHVRYIRLLAEAVADEPAAAGIELMNEPPAADRAALYSLWRECYAAARQAVPDLAIGVMDPGQSPLFLVTQLACLSFSPLSLVFQYAQALLFGKLGKLFLLTSLSLLLFLAKALLLLLAFAFLLGTSLALLLLFQSNLALHSNVLLQSHRAPHGIEFSHNELHIIIGWLSGGEGRRNG